MGNLGGLAGGDLSALGPSGADRELIAKSIGATTDMARRSLQQLSAEGQARLGETLTGLGQQDSSQESVQRAILERDLLRNAQDLISQQQIQGSQALMNLPFQRAGVQLGANQALFQQLIGSAAPALQSLLQGRLSQTTTEQKQPFLTGGDILGLAGSFIPKPGA